MHRDTLLRRDEYLILSRLVTELRVADLDRWERLKRAIEFEPASRQWPGYVAAIEYIEPCREAIHNLPAKDRRRLLAAWAADSARWFQGHPEGILDRLGIILLDCLLDRARVAAARTSNW